VSTTANKSSQLAVQQFTQILTLALTIALTICSTFSDNLIALETTHWDADCITILPFQLSEQVIVLTLILPVLEFADLIAKFTLLEI